MSYIFPVHLFNPGTVKAEPRPRTIDGGTALAGDQDVISADGGGRWYIDYSDISINSPGLERLLSQWNSYLGGGATICRVPILSLRTAPRPSGAGGIMPVSQLYYDDASFPNEVRYSAPYIVATSTSSVPAGGTRITILVSQGATIKGGEKFSSNDGKRGYVIERVTSRSGQTAECIISPPAREAIPSGSSINFEWPTVQCRLVVGQDLAAAMSFKFGSISFSFVEDFSNVG